LYKRGRAVRRLRFSRPETLEEAVERKGKLGGAALCLAGGTDLVIALRGESASLPAVEVIDLTLIASLRGIGPAAEAEGTGAPAAPGSGTDGTIRIGPLATHSEIERDPRLGGRADVLAEASAAVGSPQIRNRGTIGGNIVNASPCADTLPALIALRAVLVLRSARGTRRVPVEEAVVAPHRSALAGDEILTDIHVSPLPPGAGSAFVKLGRRNALSVSRMSVAAVVERSSGGALRAVRISAGSVTPVPRRFPEVERILEGQLPSPELYREAGEALAREMIRASGRRWSTPYKEPVVQVLLRRALQRAVAGSPLSRDEVPG
jgi:CO/xanthine dehydrogenase FAD-binding subunit